jgi:alpha-galactosidase
MPMIARRAAQQGRVGALVLLLALAFAPATTHALDNGVGRTPALAWSSWNYFMNDFNETVIKGIADGMVPSGAANSGEPGGGEQPPWSSDSSGILPSPHRICMRSDGNYLPTAPLTDRE